MRVDPLMAELQARVREQLRLRLVGRGGHDAFNDPALFDAVERACREALAASESRALLLPELLGDRGRWQLASSLDLQSHRPRLGGFIVGVKRAVLLPLTRWLFEFARDNFARQQHLNDVLFACVERLLVEQAALRAEVERLRAERARVPPRD